MATPLSTYICPIGGRCARDLIECKALWVKEKPIKCNWRCGHVNQNAGSKPGERTSGYSQTCTFSCHWWINQDTHHQAQNFATINWVDTTILKTTTANYSVWQQVVETSRSLGTKKSSGRHITMNQRWRCQLIDSTGSHFFKPTVC